MGVKSDIDKAIDARLRGYIRRAMVGRNLGVSAMAQLLDVDQSQLSRTLKHQGGVSKVWLVKMCEKLQLEGVARTERRSWARMAEGGLGAEARLAPSRSSVGGRPTGGAPKAQAEAGGTLIFLSDWLAFHFIDTG